MEITYKKKTYTLYTKKEADNKDISYLPWQQAVANGWALTDDGYVIPVLSRQGPYKGNFKFDFPIGPHWTTYKTCKVSEPKQIRSTGRSELTRKGARPALRTYARLLASGENITEEQYRMLGTIFRNDQANPAASFMRLLKYTEAQEVVAEELTGLLSGKGITPEMVIDNYKELKEAADKAAGEGDMRGLSLSKSITDVFAKMLDMRPQKVVRQLESGEMIDWDSLPEPPQHLQGTPEEIMQIDSDG